MNSEGRHHQSSRDASGSDTERVGKHADDDEGASRRAVGTGPAPSGSPDDRLTAIIPAVTDDRLAATSGPVDEVKAALDGPPAARHPGSQRRDPIDEVKAALERPASRPSKPALSQPGDRPDPGRRPPEDLRPRPGRPGPAAADRAGAAGPRAKAQWAQQINWHWVRRGLYLSAAMIVVLPIVTFAMAYFIVDVPKPGDIRTNQVSTILASDGSEIAKIVPPEGNRVDVNLNQVPVHVRQAVIAAEDRNFYTNPGFSFTRLRAGGATTTSSAAATCRAGRRSPSST